MKKLLIFLSLVTVISCEIKEVPEKESYLPERALMKGGNMDVLIWPSIPDSIKIGG